MTNSIPEFENADCVLITGSNTSEAHPLIASRIMRAKANGAKIIVVDPRTTQMSMLADMHLKQQPGTDVVWLNGLMNIIISKVWLMKHLLPNERKDLMNFKRGE